MRQIGDGSGDRASERSAARVAEVLESLKEQLGEASADANVPPEVETLVAAAVAELHRLGPAPGRGGIAPVLGTGVLQELLRRSRSTPSEGSAAHVDIRR
jgi:hypothetical protein